MLSLVGDGTAVTCVSDGAIVSMVKVLTDKLSLVLLALSVTLIVQLSYVPSSNSVTLSGLVRVTLLSPDDADDEVELPQAPPYVIVPASFDLKV